MVLLKLSEAKRRQKLYLDEQDCEDELFKRYLSDDLLALYSYESKDLKEFFAQSVDIAQATMLI